MGVSVEIDDRSMTVALSGWDAVWALKRELVLARTDIASARVMERGAALRLLRWRVGGTLVPGYAAAGHFTVRGGKPGELGFASAYRDPELLVVGSTRPQPRIVVLQVPDPTGTARQLDPTTG